MRLKTSSLLFSLFVALSSLAQIEDLTPAEIQYRDSIAKLNNQNATIAKSQEAYNAGIQLFSQKQYAEAALQFKTSVELDPNFTGAYYNKGVAENESENFAKRFFISANFLFC